MLFYKGKFFEKPHCTTRSSKHIRKDFSLFRILPWAVTNYICIFPNPKTFPIARWTTFQMEKGRSSRPFLLRGRPFFSPTKKNLSAYHGTWLDQVFIGFPVPENWLVISSCASPSPPFQPSVWLKVIHKMKMYWWEFRLSPGKIRKVLSRPHGRDFGNSVSATHHTHLATNTPTLSNTQTQRRWLLAGSWRGQNCLSRMAAHGLFLSSFLPADQNNKLSKCDGENLHFNIPQISVCSSATRAAVYAAK